jgi:hypothetical protein
MAAELISPLLRIELPDLCQQRQTRNLAHPSVDRHQSS